MCFNREHYGGVIIGKGPQWSPVEEEFLIECLKEDKNPFKISEEFHIRTKMNIKGYHKRSPAAIERRIHDLPKEQQPVDESKPAMHHKVWSPKDDERLLTYKNQGAEINELAGTFHRTESAIESRLQILKKKESVLTLLWNWLSGLGMALNKILFGTGDGGK